MRLRLGMPESAVLALGPFPEIKAADAGTMTARQGVGRFFGLPGEVTCYVNDGRLDHVRFEADSVSRHSQEYVDGQLRRMRLERGCERDDTGDRVCTWVGPGVRVNTEMKKDRLVARIEPWPPPRKTGAESLLAGPATPATAAKPAARIATPPATAPPPSARQDPPPATPTATRVPAPAARPDTAARKPAAVITLPETLTISLASRNSPDVWPRIVSSPQLNYPEEARRESIQGVVWVMALVDPTGRVLDAWVERGLPELDTAALSWISRSQFAPCERKGAPCRFHVRVAVLFTLH
jgi:TonB family protein